MDPRLICFEYITGPVFYVSAKTQLFKELQFIIYAYLSETVVQLKMNCCTHIFGA